MSDDPAAELLDRASAAGVAWLMCPGTDLQSSLDARSIALAQPGRVIWAAGLHPHDATRWATEGARIEALAVEAAAIGECGLDYYRDLSPREVQRDAFSAQVKLAAHFEKPIIVHCRDAFADIYELLSEAALGERAVLHCWTGGRKWTKRFRELGVTFSFAGPITYETGDTIRLAAAEAPPERTMVETDTPYLTPPPHRREPNEPANVVRVGEALAGVWGMPVEDVASLTTANAVRIFGGPA
jgi:TatD DNase family protein